MARKREEPVCLERKRYGFLPDAFVWRGCRYEVRHVERSWTVAQGSGAGRVERRYFRVRCDHGTVDLYHDLLANTWGMSAGAGRRPSPIRLRLYSSTIG
jgi:hypothetical protein